VLLRAYQVEAVEAARAELRGGKKRVLIVCPTGGGKTVIAADIIRRAAEKGSRILFLAHRHELIQQTCDKLTRFEVRHGVIMAGERMALQHPVQVASIQTLANRREVLKHVSLIFFDEAHHASAGTYQEVLQWYPGAVVVGLTATPWRLDGRGLGDVFDGHTIVRTPKQLRDEGHLVPVGGWEYEAIDTSKARVKGGDFVASDLAAAATSRRVLGDVVEEWKRYAAGKRTIVFAVSVEASQQMVAQFLAEGVPAEHIDGSMPTAARDAVLARLRSGQTLVVSNCNVLTEGFDCPELEVCVLARPTLSTSLYLQMVGRVLRPSPGKTVARLHDHAGCLRAHGHPYADRDYAPSSSANKRRQSMEDAAGPAQQKCPECKSVRFGWPCDACGYSPTPKELTLELLEAERRAIASDGIAPLTPEQKKAAETAGMAAKFKETSLHARRAFFFSQVRKVGLKRAMGRYRWWSGETAWPPRDWQAEARELEGPADELARFGT
jgi:superfamily II DNA or RNA helicase